VKNVLFSGGTNLDAQFALRNEESFYGCYEVFTKVADVDVALVQYFVMVPDIKRTVTNTRSQLIHILKQKTQLILTVQLTPPLIIRALLNTGKSNCPPVGGRGAFHLGFNPGHIYRPTTSVSVIATENMSIDFWFTYHNPVNCLFTVKH